jgi:TIR domain
MKHFDHHAFISYAHIDNEPLTPGQRGWVTQFHSTLQTMLSQRLGEKARIWRDEKLTGNDVFANEIVDQFANTALLISILSPRYVRSDWCTRELKEFIAKAAYDGGLTIGNKSRVFKVIKTPVEPAAALPEAVQNTLGYPFFVDDEGERKELDPAYGDEARQQFLSKLSGLAWELEETLQQLTQAEAPTAGAKPSPDRPAVFLADCGRDQRLTREQLAIELRMHGYEVLPVQPLPTTEEQLMAELSTLLERCALSVHLIGNSVGPIPDGPSGHSLIQLENEAAAKRSQQGGLRRLIWLPKDVRGERTEQQAFIAALQSEATLQLGADLLTGDVESLKGAIHQTLHQIEHPSPVAAPCAPALPDETTETGPVAHRVHLVMSDADRASAVPLLKLLRAQGVKATLPVFTGDAATLREANAQLVAESHAVILFYGAGDEAWKFHQERDLCKQAPGAAHARTPWVWLAPPSTPDKVLLQALGDTYLLDGLAHDQGAALQPLLTALAEVTKATPSS